jgi:hypothetical protein
LATSCLVIAAPGSEPAYTTFGAFTGAGGAGAGGVGAGGGIAGVC